MKAKVTLTCSFIDRDGQECRHAINGVPAMQKHLKDWHAIMLTDEDARKLRQAQYRNNISKKQEFITEFVLKAQGRHLDADIDALFDNGGAN